MSILDDLIGTANLILDGLQEFLDGGNMANQAEIKAAIIEALEESASRFLAGQAGNTVGGITINPDGSIDIDEGEGGTGGIGTNNEQRDGGCINIRLAYQKFFTDIHTWRDNDITTENILVRILASYEVDEAAMNAALTAWEAIPTVLLYNFSTSFEQWLFCKGRSQTKIGQFFIQQNPTNLNYILAFNAAFLPSQFETWYRDGIDVPSSNYVSYACWPNDVENLILPIAGANGSIGTVNPVKTNHRLLWEIEGKIQHPTEADSYFDFFYSKTASSVTWVGGVNISKLGGGIDEPAQNKVPFESDGKYRFTLDVSGANGIATISKNLVAGYSSQTEGQFTIKITDLGEIN